MKKSMKEIVRTINAMSRRKEELWLSRVVPFDKGRKEKWIISLVNKKGKATEKDLLDSLKAVNTLSRNAEYWVCEKVKDGEWLCRFRPKAAKNMWRP